MTSPVERLHGPPTARPVGRPVRPAWLAASIASADLSDRAWTLLVAAITASVVIGGAALLVGAIGIAVVVGGLATAGPVVMLVKRRDHRDRNLATATPDLLRATARALRTGATPRSALVIVDGELPGSLTRRVVRVREALDLGAPVSRALDLLTDGHVPPELYTARLALGFALDGSRAADALDAFADALALGLQLTREIETLTAQVRLSAQVLVALPAIFLALGAVAGADQIGVLVGTSTGRACLIGGLILDGLGWVWLRTLVGRVAP